MILSENRTPLFGIMREPEANQKSFVVVVVRKTRARLRRENDFYFVIARITWRNRTVAIVTSNPAMLDLQGDCYLQRHCSDTATRESPMNSHEIHEHHEQAAHHHEEAAKHHREAAKHHEAGDHEKAAHHSKVAHGHSLHATEHHEHASKKHAEQHS